MHKIENIAVNIKINQIIGLSTKEKWLPTRFSKIGNPNMINAIASNDARKAVKIDSIKNW